MRVQQRTGRIVAALTAVALILVGVTSPSQAAPTPPAAEALQPIVPATALAPQPTPWRLIGVSVSETAPAVAVWRTEVALPAGQATLILSALPRSINRDSIDAAVTAGDCTVVSVTSGQGSISVSLSAASAGVASIEVCYAFDGLNWSASYNAWLEPGHDQAVLDGWRIIQNSSGASLPPTLVYLVAAVGNSLGAQAAFRGGAQLGATVMAVPLSSALDDGASVRTPIARIPSLPAKFVYVFDRTPVSSTDSTGAPERVMASLGLEFTLPSDDGRVSYPLQAGKLHVYSRLPDGTAFRLGTCGFAATSGRGRVLATLDRAPAVKAEKHRTDQKRIGTGTVEEAYQVKLTNDGTIAADVVVIEAFPGDWTMLQSIPTGATRSPVGTAQFTLTVPPQGRVELLYRVRYTY